MIKITSDEQTFFSRYIYELSGIHLDGSKAYLMETRLKPLLDETGARSFHELYTLSRSDGTRHIEKKIIDAICTRETMFFRDQSPFELLKERILPELIARKMANTTLFPPGINIWSAGCSTGQEIYSIAIIIRELISDMPKFNVRLLGTDISSTAIETAVRGEYNQIDVERGLPEDKRHRYFMPARQKWKVNDDIRKMCKFRIHNLTDTFFGLGKFDIVFCRNVAIYFIHEDKVKLFDKIANILEPEGYLIIGSSESISGISGKFQVRMHGKTIFYQLN